MPSDEVKAPASFSFGGKCIYEQIFFVFGIDQYEL